MHYSSVLTIMNNTRNLWPSKDGLRVGYLNINHVVNKLSDVSHILYNSGKGFHIFGFAESKLSQHISDSELIMQNYHFIRKDPVNPKETGLLVYVHQNINFRRLEALENYVESVWIEVQLKRSKPIVLGFIYRNPAERVDWTDKFTSMMDDLLISQVSDEIILMGDFNIDLMKFTNAWTNIYESFNLTQLIDKPTRITSTSATLIDHIYASSTNNIIELCSPTFGCSDHLPICFTWAKRGIKVPQNYHKIINYRSFSCFDKDLFLFDLMNSCLPSVYQFTNPDEALEVWYHNFLNVYNKHAPFKTKRVKNYPQKPWMTQSIAIEISQRDELLDKGNQEEFKTQRNKVNSLKRSAKIKHFHEMISSKADSRSIWRAINQLTNNNKTSQHPIPKDISVENLNSHFCNISSSTIKSNKTNVNQLDVLEDFCLSKNITSTLNIPPMCVHEVYNALVHLKQTSTKGLDDLDGKILKMAAPIIAETLTYVYNLCISKNQVPKAFKTAKVVPIFKNGNRSDPSNYRPISILSILSKPLENHLKKHILNHFNEFSLFHPNQSGFRPNHSCHTALTNLVDQWLTNINNNEITGVLFVDFAKAFDVIDHTLLIRKLKAYGLSHNTLKLMSSFLSDRKQMVSVDRVKSQLLPISYGVPQGSVLGPILFSIYINDLPLFIEPPCELFADDTTIHTKHHRIERVSSSLQQSINDIVTWSELNHMCLHPQKTKYIVITTRQKRQNLLPTRSPLYINGVMIEEVSHHKVLGLIIDNNLSWSQHVMMTCKTLSKKIHQLSRIKHFLNKHCRKLFFHAYIEPHVNYASTIWDSASENVLKQLMSLHRRALKLIHLKSSSLTVSDYKDLDILPFKWKLIHNKALFMFKIMSGFAPPYLKQRFLTSTIRNNNKIMVPLPRIDLFKSSLTYSGGCLWNNILTSFNVHTSITVFKKRYHEYLMENFANSV